MSRSRPELISPTAHYTGYVWFAHGQSHEAFATRTGRLLYGALRGPNLIANKAVYQKKEADRATSRVARVTCARATGVLLPARVVHRFATPP